jgi:hypothetical protein
MFSNKIKVSQFFLTTKIPCSLLLEHGKSFKMNLYKGTFSGWKEFLFVENKNFFYYYKSEKDETPSGWMNLTGAKGKKKFFNFFFKSLPSPTLLELKFNL